MKTNHAVKATGIKLLLIVTVVGLAFLNPACMTTKDAGGSSTTTVDATGQAAITAAIQIASAAATAAIQTYLTTAPHGRLAASNPAMVAAKKSTEAQIRETVPSLSPAQVHSIVTKEYANKLRGE